MRIGVEAKNFAIFIISPNSFLPFLFFSKQRFLGRIREATVKL
jgi:hypothetical protein